MDKCVLLFIGVVCAIVLAVAALFLFMQVEAAGDIKFIVIGALISLVTSLGAALLKVVDKILKD